MAYQLMGVSGNIGVGSNAPSQAGIKPTVVYGPPAPKKNNNVQGVSTQYTPTKQPVPTPTPTNTGGGGGGGGGNGRYTASDALNAGLDINQLRSQGLLNEDAAMAEQNKLIDEAYGSGLGVYNDVLRQIQENYPQEQQNLESKIAGEIGKANTQQEELIGGYETQQQDFNRVIESALEQAYRARNALSQQASARFGLGNSAGRAMGELANQEFFRQQGNIQEKQATGNRDFATEVGKVKTYIAQKIDDLNQYKNEALLTLKQSMQDRINEINARKGELEANKAAARLSIMQDTVSRIRYVADQDKQFRQNLALAAVSQMQEVAGRAFTPREISTTLSEFGISVPSITTSQQGPVNQTTGFGNENDDEYQSLM